MFAGFRRRFGTKFSQRLQLKFLDHLPDEPYLIDDVQSAARFVLHGTNSTPSSHLYPTPAPASLDGVIKAEQLGSIFTEFTKSIIEAINSTQNRPRGNGGASDSGPRDIKCNFCGKGSFYPKLRVSRRIPPCRKNLGEIQTERSFFLRVSLFPAKSLEFC